MLASQLVTLCRRYVEILMKHEGFNPCGSVKERIALALIPMARYANAYPDGPSLGSLHVLLPDRVRFTALDGS